MLTIGVLFCDNDFQYLENLTGLIQERVQLPYELILFDNRNDCSTDISFLNDYKVLNTGDGNQHQVEGRRQIIKEASGDYIWFIDADDEPLEIDSSFKDLLDLNYDLYSFNYKKDCNPEICDVYKEEQLFTANEETGNLCYKEAFGLLVNVLWNKWIKTSVLKEVVESIPEGTHISASEDLMLVIATLKHSKTELRSPLFIYKNNSMHGSSGYDDYSNNIEKYERCIFGINEATDLICSLLTETEQTLLDLNEIRIQDCVFFGDKIARTADEETRKQMFEILTNTFDKDLIKETWKQHYLNGWRFSEEEYNRFYELMTTKFEDLFDYNEVTIDYVYDDGTTETLVERNFIKPLWKNETITTEE